MQRFQDYVQISRLNRPIGIWLLLFPGFMGLSFQQGEMDAFLFGVFAVGAWAMRGAGCIYNDIIDQKFDAHVKRTQTRPLVRPENPLPFGWAVVFLIMHASIGLACLLMLNTQSICVGFLAALLILGYPWMKRITYWPQFFLGFTMNMGFVMGVAATGDAFSLGGGLFYAGLVVWTLGYDTVYGFQDMEDDALIGVRSSTFKVAAFSNLFIALCYGFALCCWLIAGRLLEVGYVYYAGVLLAGSVLLWQALTLAHTNSGNCLARFKSNQWVAILLWLGLALQQLL
jgi:4-hydroxybenzoate polyprenyltransferase